MRSKWREKMEVLWLSILHRFSWEAIVSQLLQLRLPTAPSPRRFSHRKLALAANQSVGAGGQGASCSAVLLRCQTSSGSSTLQPQTLSIVWVNIQLTQNKNFPSALRSFCICLSNRLTRGGKKPRSLLINTFINTYVSYMYEIPRESVVLKGVALNSSVYSISNKGGDQDNGKGHWV